MMSIARTLTVIAALTATPALAQVNSVPADVKPGAYVVEPHHTQVGFRVLHMGFSFFTGRFSDVSGTLTLDPEKPAKSVIDVSVPVASVSTPSDKLDDELKDTDWLDAKQFPTMTFKSTQVTPTGKGHADVAGNLTLHGVTKPIVLHVQFVGSGVNPLDKKYTAGFDISGDVDRSAFGVTKYVPLIGNTVHLSIAGAFEQK